MPTGAPHSFPSVLGEPETAPQNKVHFKSKTLKPLETRCCLQETTTGCPGQGTRPLAREIPESTRQGGAGFPGKWSSPQSGPVRQVGSTGTNRRRAGQRKTGTNAPGSSPPPLEAGHQLWGDPSATLQTHTTAFPSRAEPKWPLGRCPPGRPGASRRPGPGCQF